MLPFGVDAAYKMGQGLMPSLGDLLQATPKVIFNADTSIATSNSKRTRFHRLCPPPLVTYDGLAALSPDIIGKDNGDHSTGLCHGPI